MSALARVSSIAAVLTLVAACDGAPTRSPTDVRTTSATFPDPTTLPPTSHTVYSAGAADNDGKTGDVTTRSEFSGMRPTEAGDQSPTGTPGSGLPIPIEKNPKLPESERVQRQKPVTAGPPKGAPAEQETGRLAEAWCDREAFCGRVGEGKAYGSSTSCIDRHRESVRNAADSAGCPNGFDSAQVSACLNALRRAECSAKVSRIDAVTECNLGTLCLAAK